MSETFEPIIIGFTCNWCSYRAADMAGTAREKYPPNARLIRLMCSGRLDPTFVLKALAEGADGVMITGCHPGDCHYVEQNYKTMQRYRLLKRVLAQMGIEQERVRLVWASAAEGVKLAREITRMVEEVRALGPLNWRGVIAGDGAVEVPAEPVSADMATDCAATPAHSPGVAKKPTLPPGAAPSAAVKKPTLPPGTGRPTGVKKPTLPPGVASFDGAKKPMPPPGADPAVEVDPKDADQPGASAGIDRHDEASK